MVESTASGGGDSSTAAGILPQVDGLALAAAFIGVTVQPRGCLPLKSGDGQRLRGAAAIAGRSTEQLL